MQQQIRGWRFAAERTRRRRGARDVPLAAPARMMTDGMAAMACRALNRMAMRVQSARMRRRAPATTRVLRAMPVMRTRSRRPGRSLPAMADLPGLPTMADLRAMQAMRAMQTMQAMRVMRAMRARAMPAMRSMPEIDVTTVKRVAGGMGVVVAGMGVARWMASRPRTPMRTARQRAPENRWIMVTVNCSPQRLASRADLPEPITRLGDAVDIKICPAPGDRGTELGARLRELPRTSIAGMVMRRPEEDPRLMVERALRDAKAIIETGEVLRKDWPPSAQPAQVGELLEFAGRRGGRP